MEREEERRIRTHVANSTWEEDSPDDQLVLYSVVLMLVNINVDPVSFDER